MGVSGLSLVRSVSGKCQATVSTVSRVSQFAELLTVDRLGSHSDYVTMRNIDTRSKQTQHGTATIPLPTSPYTSY
jgi:hypothetical protein